MRGLPGKTGPPGKIGIQGKNNVFGVLIMTSFIL